MVTHVPTRTNNGDHDWLVTETKMVEHTLHVLWGCPCGQFMWTSCPFPSLSWKGGGDDVDNPSRGGAARDGGVGGTGAEVGKEGE